jgi:hypothetical protein
MVPMVVEEDDREIDMGDRTMTDGDFSPTDVAGLAAWFARAEANAAGLRQRLDDLGGEWRSPPPKPVRQAAETGVGAQGTGWAAATGKAAVRPPHRRRGRRNGR